MACRAFKVLEVLRGVGKPPVLLNVIFVAPGADGQPLCYSAFFIRLNTMGVVTVSTLGCTFLCMNGVPVHIGYAFMTFNTDGIADVLRG